MASQGHSDLRLYRRALIEARPYWPHIGAYFLISLLASPLALLAPLPMKIAVDSVLGSQPLPGPLERLVPEGASGSGTVLIAVAAGVVGLALLRNLQGLAASLTRAYASEHLVLGFRTKLFGHAQRLSLSYHDAIGTSDSIYKIQYDTNALSRIAVDGVIPLVISITTVCSMLFVILSLDPTLALVSLGVVPFLVFFSTLYRSKVRPRYRQLSRTESSALAVIQEVLTALRVVSAFGQEDREADRFVRRSGDGVRQRLSLERIEGAFNIALQGSVAVGTALVLFVGVRHVQSETLTLGELLLVMGYLGQFYDPLRSIAGRLASMQSALTGAERAFALLDERPTVVDMPDARPLTRARGALDLDHVSFAYDGKHPVIEDISLQIPAGARVGIYGSTGAGKTTLLNLVTRFYEPTSGRITLDGQELRAYRLKDLRAQFGIMLQEPVLFAATIAENIGYAKDGASDEEIVEAALLASAHDFITALPDGYRTMVGERGMRLSGGERQRISLARAFLKDAPILILDEPTSSVDVATEASIMEAMERLMAGRTTLMIAHRLSTLDDCDLWVHLEHGRVASISTSRPPAFDDRAPSGSTSGQSTAGTGDAASPRLKCAYG